MDKDKQNIDDVETTLYSSVSGPMAIEGSVKKKILAMLAEHDYSFDDLVKATEKAKSTTSVHIRDLEDAGLISSRPDDQDKRKRILSLSSRPIGFLSNKDRNAAFLQINSTDKNFPFTPGDISSFFRYAIKVFRTEAMVMGINIDPILLQSGIKVGKIISKMINEERLEGLVSRIDDFWQEYGLGNIELVSEDPITLKVKGCFECEDLPKTGHGTCSFDTGVLTIIFSEFLKVQVQVKEVECYSSNYDHCLFVILKNNN